MNWWIYHGNRNNRVYQPTIVLVNQELTILPLSRYSNKDSLMLTDKFMETNNLKVMYLSEYVFSG